MRCQFIIKKKSILMRISKRQELPFKKNGPLFRSSRGRSGKLTKNPLRRDNALPMVKRRAMAAGLTSKLCNHSFRATGITAFIAGGRTVDKARQMARTQVQRRQNFTTEQVTKSRSMKLSGLQSKNSNELTIIMTDNETVTVSEVTRGNIFDALTVATFPWWGRLSETQFLSRIFDLDSLPSYDPRYQTASSDIAKHREFNNDWDDDWIFYDRRFNLLRCPDALLFKFLAEIAHPVVQSDATRVTWFVDVCNQHLAADKWGLAKKSEISGRPIFEVQRLSDAPTSSRGVHTPQVAGTDLPLNISQRSVVALREYLRVGHFER